MDSRPSCTRKFNVNFSSQRLQEIPMEKVPYLHDRSNSRRHDCLSYRLWCLFPPLVNPNPSLHYSLPANYKSAIDMYEGGPNIRTVTGDNATAGIFCTYPQPFMTKTGQFFSEFIASTILMFCIYSLQDNGNLGAGNLTPLGLFFVIFGIGACFGWETGYAINLARDFGTWISLS